MNKVKPNLFSLLPSVDSLLKNSILQENKNFTALTSYQKTSFINKVLKKIRVAIKNTEISEAKELTPEKVIMRLQRELINYNPKSLKRVINGTGTIIHTNLGRTPSSKVQSNDFFYGYNNLEYDLVRGSRGSRYDHVEELLVELTGSEGALVVNNNAAAVLLVLSEFAKGKEAIISRGELVEIGGSFRIPDIIASAGAILREVGTTNKTHLYDFERAISEETGILLKVHTSNFLIQGFTEMVSGKEISKLAKANNLISIEDLGSGTLVDLREYGLPYEPTVQESIRSGMDIVTFSGDKLLCGPQCGIIVGKKEYIERLKKNQLLRALRINKESLYRLEEILELYLDKDHDNLPLYHIFRETLAQTKEKGEHILENLGKLQGKLELIRSEATIGGGSLPTTTLPSYALKFKEGDGQDLHKHFRSLSLPIVGLIREDAFIIDLKCIFNEELVSVSEGILKVLGESDE